MSHKVKSGLRTWLVFVTVLSVVGCAAIMFVSWMATRKADDAWNAYYDELRAAGKDLHAFSIGGAHEHRSRRA